MADHFETIVSKGAACCAHPPRRRGLWAQALGAAMLALIVACGEVALIKHTAVADASGGPGGQDDLVRAVDNSLASGLAPIAILR